MLSAMMRAQSFFAAALLLAVTLVAFLGYAAQAQELQSSRFLLTDDLELEIPFVDKPQLLLRSKRDEDNSDGKSLYYNITLQDVREQTAAGDVVQGHRLSMLTEGLWSDVKLVVHPNSWTHLQIDYSYSHVFLVNGNNVTVPLRWRFKLSNYTLNPSTYHVEGIHSSSSDYENYGTKEPLDDYLESADQLRPHHLGLEFIFGEWPFVNQDSVLTFRFRVSAFANGVQMNEDSLIWDSILDMGHLSGIEMRHHYPLRFRFSKYALVDNKRPLYVGIGVNDVFDALDFELNFPAYDDSLYYIMSLNTDAGSGWAWWVVFIVVLLVAAAVIIGVSMAFRRWCRKSND